MVLAHITKFLYFDADMTMFNKWCTMIMACVFGFTLAVIFLRTKSIGAVITLHVFMGFRGFYESHDDSGTLQIWWFVQCACIADTCSDSDACYCGFLYV